VRIRLFRLFLPLLLAIALPSLALAQPTGRIEGRVFDGSTGEPLVGGQVVITETDLGSVTRPDGTFFIDGVPAGVQRVSAEYLGYEETRRETRVLPGETSRVEFALGGAAIEASAIVATIVHEPWIPSVALPPRAEVDALPALLPATTPLQRCTVEAVLHGAYILNGRWQMQTSVGHLRCSPSAEEETTPCDRVPARLAAAVGRHAAATR
jgi:hypothetical protein